MTVLSKQYSLCDLINLRVRDKDNFNLVNKGMCGVEYQNLLYNTLYQIARSYPNMTYDEIDKIMWSKNIGGCKKK